MLPQGCRMLAATLVALAAIWTGAASAQQPIEPLGGQLRLTQEGADGDATVRAQGADVAYNSQRNEFLVVWERRSGTDTEIFARRLQADGAPLGAAFQISAIASDPDGFDSRQTAVTYDFERDRYVVAFTRDQVLDDREVFVQLVRGSDGALLNSSTGAVGEAPRLMSLSATNSTFNNEIDVAYRPDANGDESPGDIYAVAYGADEAAPNEFDVMLAGFNAETGLFTGLGFDKVVNEVALEDAIDPAMVPVPGTDELAVVWEGSAGGSDFEIYARRAASNLDPTGAQKKITSAGDASHDATNPAITRNSGAAQFLVAYQANVSDAEGTEVYVQRLESGLSDIGADDQQVSSAGQPGSAGMFFAATPALDYNPVLNRYLVTWVGNDNSRPGFANDEEEMMGTALDANGVELEPQDFTISRMGAENDDAPFPSDAAVSANTQSGRWLSVWSSDDARPPLADNEFEVWGRQIGENFDRDGDGVNVPADCDDANPGIRPGANDVFDNGIDEDCAGGDAQNPDRDGDGATRPGDCNDGNPSIRPGAVDVPNNEIDEDCAGGPRRTIVDVGIERFFAVFRTHTKVTRLRVTQLKPGMRIELRCKGKGCPKPLRKKKVRRVRVKQRGSHSFTKLFKKARLKPKAVIDVRVFQPGAIARVDKFTVRKAKLPTRKQRCSPPGAKQPAKCGA
jgi:hypothetical protein